MLLIVILKLFVKAKRNVCKNSFIIFSVHLSCDQMASIFPPGYPWLEQAFLSY